MMFELRVLDGLRQGAALPLFGERWSIGAHADADLMLNDPGVVEQHACLRFIDANWLVQAEAGLLRDPEGQVLAQIAKLELNVPFTVGGGAAVRDLGRATLASTRSPCAGSAGSAASGQCACAGDDVIVNFALPAKAPDQPGAGGDGNHCGSGHGFHWGA